MFGMTMIFCLTDFLWPLYMNLLVNKQVCPVMAEHEVDVLKGDDD